MKVTSYYPAFHTYKLSDEMLAFFADMGMKKIHTFKLENREVLTFGNEAGQRLDIVADDDPPADIPSARMMRANVDNFDEGLAYFAVRGFTPRQIEELESAKTATLVNPADPSTIIFLYQHKKG